MSTHPHPGMDALLGDPDPDITAALAFFAESMENAANAGPAALIHAVLVLATEDPPLAKAALRVVESYLMDHGATRADFDAIAAEFRRGAEHARAAHVAARMRQEGSIDPTH